MSATTDDQKKPHGPPGSERIQGRLIIPSRSSIKHTLAASALGGALTGPFHIGNGKGSGKWWILDTPELHFGADVLVPDLAGWQRQRLPQLPNAAWFDLAPDWVCEILSVATARQDRVIKMPLYARLGIAHLWLVDPELQTLESYVLEAGHWMLLDCYQGDDRLDTAPFEGASVKLSALWSPTT